MEKKREKNNSGLLKAGIIAATVIVAAVLVYSLVLAPSGFAGLSQQDSGTAILDPSKFASRQAYFEEAFKPKRNEYMLFEKASVFLNKPVSEIPAFFSLKSEEEIFSSLPAVPKDFSEIAYLLASGKYFGIGHLDEGYYKQPEFYPNFKEYGLKYWSKPDPKYWVTNGYGSYPSEQWDTLKIGEREEFNAVVFFYSGYGVQTFQGVTLMPDSASMENFEISITPQSFLLEPAFPKFYNGWAHKIEISGKLRQGVKPGNYTIGINVEMPPKELKEKWGFEHRNLYFDAASGFKPEGNQIQLNITVEQ